MEFLQEILSAAGADTLRAFTVVPGFGGYFKVVKGVTEFSPGKIVLVVGDMRVSVEGENLTVGRYFMGDMFISVVISSVCIL